MRSVNQNRVAQSGGRHRAPRSVDLTCADVPWFAVESRSAEVSRRRGAGSAPLSAFVGRVGALAIALGVGVAVVMTPGIATADGGDGETGNTTTDTQPDDAETPDDVADDHDDELDEEPVEPSDSETVSAETVSAETPTDDDTVIPVAVVEEPVTNPASDATETPVVDSDPPVAAPILDEPAAEPRAVDTGARTAFTDADLPANSQDTTDIAVHTTTLDVPVQLPAPEIGVQVQRSSELVPTTALNSSALVLTSSLSQPSSQLAAPAEIVTSVFTALLVPLLAPTGPAAPAQAPVFWAVLAWVRRQFEHTFQNKAPIVVNNNDLALVDPNTVTGTVAATDPDPEDRVTLSATGGHPDAQITVTPSGQWTYTAPSGWDGTTAYTDTFTITATEFRGGLLGVFAPRGRTATTTVTVSITPVDVDEAPVAVDDTDTTIEDTAATGNVLANDLDIDTPATELYVVTTTAGTEKGGTVTFTPGGGYTYNPPAEFAGTDSVTYTMTDGTSTATATLRITVTAHDDAPVAVDDTGSGDEGVAVVVDVLANDTDIDSENLSVADIGDPAHGAVTRNIDGTLTYTPEAGFFGDDSFTYTVTDGTSVSAPATVFLTIAAPPENRPPEVGAVPYESALNTATGVVSGTVDVDDPDGDELSFTVAQAPDPMFGDIHVDPTTGEWSFTPTLAALLYAWDAETSVPDVTFTVIASDGEFTTEVPVTVSLGVPQDSLVTLLERAGSQPSAVAVGSDGRVYVTNSGANTLTIIDPYDSSRITVPVGHAPVAVAPGPGDGRVWVVNYADNTVSVRSSYGAVLREIPVGAGPSAIAVSPERVYVTNSADNTVTVIKYDYGVERTVAVGAAPVGVAIGPDGRAYVATSGTDSISIIDPANDFAVTTVDLDGVHAQDVVVAADGSVYLTDRSTSTVTTLRPDTDGSYGSSTVVLGAQPTTLSLGADGKVYVARADGQITVIDPETSSVTELSVSEAPSSIAVGADGTVYVTHAGSDELTVVTPGSDAAVGVDVGVDTSTITVGSTGELLVVSTYDGSMRVISRLPDTIGQYDIATMAPGGSVSGHAMAVGPNGETYVATSGYFGSTISQYDSGGTWVRSAHFNNFLGGVDQLAVDPNGHVYALNWNQSNGQSLIKIDMANNTTQQVYSGRLSGLVVDDDGRVYVVDAGAGNLMVFDETGTVLQEIPVSTASYLYRPNSLILGPDGEVYVTSTIESDGESELVVVHPDDFAVERIELDRVAQGVAVGNDGRIYLSNPSDLSITVLNTNYSVARVLPVGVTVSQMAVAPDGNVFAAGPAGTVVVVNPDDYSLKTISMPTPEGGHRWTEIHVLKATKGGVAVQVLSPLQNNPNGVITSAVHHLARPVIETPTDPDPTDPTDPAPVLVVAPDSVDDLWENVREHTSEDDSGVFVQTIKGEDGKIRAIVYIGGTQLDSAENQAYWENLPTYQGKIKGDQVEAIDAALRACSNNPSCGAVEEIMIVGYSQGGMDAQNLTYWNGLNTGQANRVPVTTVVTYGSPVVAINLTATTIHIRDEKDEVITIVTNAVEPVSAFFSIVTLQPVDAVWIAARQISAHVRGEIYTARSDTIPGELHEFTVHSTKGTYQELSHDFENTPDSQFTSQKENIDRFLGGVAIDPGTYVEGEF